MTAVDTNVLVYAFIGDAPRHGRAAAALRSLAMGDAPWGLPHTCIGQFLRVVTHRAFRPLVPLATAFRFLELLLASPTVQLLTPTSRHVPLLREVLEESGATGVLVYDAQIATLCLEYGVREILTADKDFRRFSGLKVTDPFA
jgi:hypothetical protein